MTYPASKQDILTKAQENGGDEQIRSVLQALPEKQYTRPTDVTAAVKDIDNS